MAPAIYINESLISSTPAACSARTCSNVAWPPWPLFIAQPLTAGRGGGGQAVHRWARCCSSKIVTAVTAEVIMVWKFRSMRVHDDGEVRQASREDDRITRSGAFAP